MVNPRVDSFDPGRDASLIGQLASQLQVEVTAAVREQLALYVQQVASWNRKVNLTGARDPRSLVEVLLADALMLAGPERIAAGARVLDVGTGAGAPIVPLLLLRGDASALCVEPHAKRATFLRMLSVRLSLLGRMRVLEARVDLERPVTAEAFDVACSRATFAPGQWLRAGLALAPRALVLTAHEALAGIPADALLESEVEYQLPFSGAPRRISVYRRG